MRRPVFKRWIQKEAARLAGFSTFRLREIAAAMQGSGPRAKEPLLLYALEADRFEKLLELIWRDDIREEYRTIADMLRDINLSEAAVSGNIPENLPREYAKHLTSFASEYHKPETQAESKRLRWEKSRQLQLQKGISAAYISQELGLNRGNVNAYLKHGDVNKVSLQNATNIMKLLMAL